MKEAFVYKKLKWLEQSVLYLLANGGGGGGSVTTVFGRSGAVTAQNGDYTVAQITGALSSTGDGSGLTGLTKSQVGLSNVENTALSTWAGSSNITTLGTITTGVWNGTVIPINKGGTGQTAFTDGRIPFVNAGVLTDSANLQYSSGMVGLGSLPTHTLTLASTATGVASYNTSDQTTNYERVVQYWTGNEFIVEPQNGGTGVARVMRFRASANYGISVTAAPSLTGFNRMYNTSVTSANIVGSAAGGVFGSSSAGVQCLFSVQQTVSQSGSAGYRSLWITTFEQSAGSGIKNLIDAGTSTSGNGAGTYTSKFSLASSGVLSITAPTYADNAAALAGGLVAGQVYKTATGELRIVV